MRRRQRVAIYVSLGVVLCAFLFQTRGEGAYSTETIQQTPAIHMGIPPRNLWWGLRGHSKWTVSGGVRASMSYDTSNKAVIIDWTTVGVGKVQVIPTPYFPTSAILLTPNRLGIAGKLPRGNTVIEEIGIQDPTLSQTFPSGEPDLILGAITSREYKYNEATEGRDMVHFMKTMLHDDSQLLIRFYDSGAIYRLDIPAQTIHLQASAQTGQGGSYLYVPEIAENRYTNSWGGRHTVHSHVYVFRADLQPWTAPLVLIDSTYDGDMDSYLLTTEAQWSNLGLGDATLYEDW